jgi:hypothetical protein
MSDTPPEVKGMIFALYKLNYSQRKTEELLTEWGF